MTTPADLARKRLDKRAQEQLSLINKITPKRLLKSPSQKRSEAGRKKELKRGGIKGVCGVEDYPDDCHGCPEKKGCGKLLEMCGKPFAVHKCLGCGIRVRHRVSGVVWEYCPVCSEGRSRG